MTPTNPAASLDLTPATATIAADGTTTHLRIRVSPPAPGAGASRRPVAVALVLDRSGSMAAPAVADAGHRSVPDGPAHSLHPGGDGGSKIAWLRTATANVVDALPDGDALSIVLFDDRVEVAVPLVVLSPATRPAVTAAIARAAPRGSTNLAAGLRAGLDQVGGETTAAGFARRVIVLSDGLANVGVTNPDSLASMARAAVVGGITVSTVGFGVDYDADLMRVIAESGDGDTVHIDEGTDLEGTVVEQIVDIRAAATDASLVVEAPAGLAVGANLNDYGQDDAASGVTIRLGSLVRTREVLVPLTFLGGVPADPTVTIRASVEHAVPSGARVRAHAVLGLVLVPQAGSVTVELEVLTACIELIAARARRVASGRYEKGQAAAALQALVEGGRTLDGLAAAYAAAALRAAEAAAAARSLRELADRMRDRTLTLLDSKRTFGDAQSMSRSRPVAARHDRR